MKINVDADGVTKHAVLDHERLLPCPFCGGTDLSLENTHTASYWIKCDLCGAQIDGDPQSGNTDTDHRMASGLAIMKWNKRQDEVDFLASLKELPFFEFVLQIKERRETLENA